MRLSPDNTGPMDCMLMVDGKPCGVIEAKKAEEGHRLSTVEVAHYLDKSNLECDMVVHRRNGTYGLVEVKLGGETLIEKGAASLKTLEAKLDTTRMPPPAFKVIVTAVGNFAYRRTDGVIVSPVACLAP